MCFFGEGYVGNLCLSVFFINSVVQFRNAFTVLPDINAEPSQLQRIIHVVCTALKYVASIGCAMAVFPSGSRDVIESVLCGIVLLLVTDLGIKAKLLPKTNFENVESEFRQAVGSHIAAEFSLTAIASGIGGSVLYYGGLSCISGVLNRNVYDCLYGTRNIGLVAALILPFIKGQIHHVHLLEKNLPEFTDRFSLAVYRAKEASEKLSLGHFYGIYNLALGYCEQNVRAVLKTLPANETYLYFYENQPYLSEQEVKEFLEFFKIPAWKIWFCLDPEQFQDLFLPKNIVHFLTEKGLQQLQDEVEALKEVLMTAIDSDDLAEEQRENQIYQKVQQEQKKIEEYSDSIYELENVLGRINPEDGFLDTKEYVTELKNLTPQITLLKEKIAELETLIEEHTGELTKPVHEAIGGKGIRVSDCEEILGTLHLPLKQPFKTVSQLLVDRGIKNQYDLIEKGIFVLEENLEKFKERLIDFLLRSNPPLQPVPVQNPSSSFDMSSVAKKIYKHVAFPFFCALQFYAQPVGSFVGMLGGIIAHKLLRGNAVYSRYLNAMSGPEGVWDDGSNLYKILYIVVNAQLTMFYFTRLGFISALLFGSGLPFRSHVFHESFR